MLSYGQGNVRDGTQVKGPSLGRVMDGMSRRVLPKGKQILSQWPCPEKPLGLGLQTASRLSSLLSLASPVSWLSLWSSPQTKLHLP